MRREKKYWTRMRSPVGELFLAVRGGRVTDILFGRPKSGFPGPVWERSDRSLREVKRQLAEYFRGDRRTFELELSPEGTPFQLAAWRQLRMIPYGMTISYGEQARRMGKPNAARAVGAANGKNPISIIVPCHRVIGADGSLTGFGGGIGIKRSLLELEAAAGFRR
jgi:methylated-DNA-[protein]-cysteine S-methyltransferase